MRKFFGTVMFYCLLPLFLFLGLVWWRRDTMFIIDNIYTVFKG